MIHGGSLTLKSEMRLNFTTGRGKSGLLLLSPNEIEDLLLASGKFSHRCSVEHYKQRRDSGKKKGSPFSGGSLVNAFCCQRHFLIQHCRGMQVKPRKEVHRETARSIEYYSSRPIQFVSKRIEELDQETSLEAFVYRGGAALTIVGLTLLLLQRKNRAAWILVVIIAALQLQYSYQGHNRLTDILRKRGYRSRKEIEGEKYSLEALRGDFAIFSELSDPMERARKCLEVFL